jgi:hypothetical protein
MDHQENEMFFMVIWIVVEAIVVIRRACAPTNKRHYFSYMVDLESLFSFDLGGRARRARGVDTPTTMIGVRTVALHVMRARDERGSSCSFASR